jgi:hypothetical protein
MSILSKSFVISGVFFRNSARTGIDNIFTLCLATSRSISSLVIFSAAGFPFLVDDWEERVKTLKLCAAETVVDGL